MALTLAQKDDLTTDTAFIGRCRQALREHAAYIVALGGGATTAQTDWKNQIFDGNRAAQATANMMGELVCDVAVAGSSNGTGSDVTDANLKTAVDTICEHYS